MNKIIIETIPHKDQAYPTVGDWRRDEDGTLRIRVSKMGNDDYEALVALHELVEVILCEKRGVKAQAVDDYDRDFERKRKPGDDREPGDEPDAPYHKEHVFASTVEQMMSNQLGVDWDAYDEAVNSLR
jgi:hypothetical protein